MVHNPVSTQELSRLVVFNLSERSADHPTPNQVASVYKCIGKFISYMFRQSQSDWQVADIPNFGSVFRNSANANTTFIPASQLQAELPCRTAMPPAT